MPRGYRCIILAAFGWLSLTGANPTNRPPQKPEPQKAADPQRNPSKPLTVRIVGDDYAADPNAYDPRCYKAANHDRADLCAQWRAAVAAEKAADATLIADYIAGGGAALSLISLLCVLWALKQGRDANKIARTGMVAEGRAWLKISGFLMRLRFSSDSVEGEATIKIENVGKSVATDIITYVTLHWSAPGDVIQLNRDQIPRTSYYERRDGSSLWQGAEDIFPRTVAHLNPIAVGIAQPAPRLFLRMVAEYRIIHDEPHAVRRISEIIYEVVPRKSHDTLDCPTNPSITEIRHVETKPGPLRKWRIT